MFIRFRRRRAAGAARGGLPGRPAGVAGLVVMALTAAGCGGPAPGGLAVEVTPPAARIYLEGEFLGAGRGRAERLRPGEYHVRVDPPPGYLGETRVVAVPPGETARLAFELGTQAARSRMRRDAAAAKAAAEEAALVAAPRVVLKTSKGAITCVLYEADAPNTVANFLALADRGFYDGTRFHRVIAGFMIQGGDPNSRDDDPSDDGRGGPGYAIADEFSGRRHAAPGVLSMANSGPDSGGSQFFITLAATPHLDGKHAVFGRVTRGMEVVEAIGRTPTAPGDRPVEPVTLEGVTIENSGGREFHPRGLDDRPVELPGPAR